MLTAHGHSTSIWVASRLRLSHPAAAMRALVLPMLSCHVSFLPSFSGSLHNIPPLALRLYIAGAGMPLSAVTSWATGLT